MTVGYDLQADALYVTLDEHAEVAHTVQVDSGTPLTSIAAET
jgi:uncharacterized protein YuzE